MATPQQLFSGQEHSSANTRLTTDVHGLVEYFISIDPPTNQVKSMPVFVGGSTHEVARSVPSGEGFPQLVMKVRRSGILLWEAALRTKFALAPNDDLPPLALPLRIQIISAPFDEVGSPLPTVVKTFTARYHGSAGGSDRKSNDPLEEEIYLQQTSPSRTT